jgi:LysM repeat protein
VASDIDAFWTLLHTQGCLDSANSTLNVTAASQLGSPPIAALVADTGLFPTAALPMSLSSATHAATIVLTGTLQGVFLGVKNPAAVATFSIDGSNVPQLSLAVTLGAGYTLATSFPALATDYPGVLVFPAATFTAASAGLSLTFAGAPTLTADIAGLWPKGSGALTGVVTLPAAAGQLPTFALTTPLVGAPFGAGQTPLAIQLSLTSSPADGASGAVLGQATINSAWPATALSMALPADEVAPMLASAVLDQPVTDLIQAAPLFTGQALANLIPARFPIGDAFTLTSLQLWLEQGGGSLSAVQIDVALGVTLNLLPNNLAALTGVDVSFWAPSGSVAGTSVIFNGDFALANSALLLTASFSLPDCQVSVVNSAPIDVGVLVGALIPGLSPPRGQLTIQTLQAMASPIDGAYSFSGEVDFGPDWSITLGRGVKALALESVTFSAIRTSGQLDLTFGAQLVFMDSTFDLTAAHDPNSGWNFTGFMLPTKPLKLKTVAAALLPFVPSGYVPEIQVLQLAGAFNTDLDTYSISSKLEWVLDIPSVDVTILADFQLQSSRASKSDTPTFSGYVKGEVDINSLVLKVSYIFSPTAQDIIFQYKDLTVDYHRDPTDPYVSISLTNSSVGSLLEFLLSFADPGNDFKLSSPWDALEKIGLPNLTVKVHLVSKEIDVEVDLDADLGFIDITKFTLSYVRQYGKANLNVGLYGTFLGQDYTTTPLGWDLLNDPAPSVPGKGTQTFDLEYFGMGQRLSLREPPPATMDGVIKALENALTPTGNPKQNPATQLPGLAFDAASNWLIGTRFTVMSTVELSVVFNDPNLYGLLLQLSGEKAGIFAGLRFEILYRKISDTIGLYHIELTLPDEMRHLEFGEVSITLPIITVDIYTNGNFRIDLGFPPSMADFSRSFSVQVFPFIGYGGFYFAVLNGQTSTQVPTIDSGQFNPVLEFGFALQVGVGKTLSLGILSGGISVTVGGMLQGVLAWYHPSQSNLPSERFYKLVGTIAIVGQVYATVDFGIIQASVSLTVYVSATLNLECYKAIVIEASAGVEVEVSIKILFIRFHFSFSATITERFVIGSDSTPPWHVIPGPAPQQQQIARGAYRARPALARPIPRGLLRGRPARMLSSKTGVLRSFAAAAVNSIDVSVIPLISQALTSDFGFPGGPAVPAGVASPTLAVLLGVATSNDPTSGFNQLEILLLEWAIGAIGHEHGAISAAVLDEIAEALQRPDAIDAYFTYPALVQLFTANGVVFNLVPRPDSGSGLTDTAFMAMIPEIELDAPSYTLKFWTDRTPVGDYEATVKQYFASLMARFAQQPTQTTAANDDAESLATFVFRNYFLMLARGVVQSARDAIRLASHAVTNVAQTSLASVANSFNNDYSARASDTDVTIAALFGVAAPAIRAANPDLDFSDLAVGQAVFIPALNVTYLTLASDTAEGLAACFGLAVADLEAANPGVNFSPLAAGQSLAIPALRVAHTALASETAADIAAEFAVTVDQLAAANPGVSLNPLAAGVSLLIPLSVTAVGVAAANQARTDILQIGAVMPLGDITVMAASTDSLTSLAGVFGVSLIALMTANQESASLLASGQAIALGDLSCQTRDGDSLGGLAAYWGLDVTALSTANPTLALAPQTLVIPLATGDTPYVVKPGDTLATLIAQGATIAAVAAYNQAILLTKGQTATLPAVVHTTSANYFVSYTATDGDTLTTIAQHYFPAAQLDAAILRLRQWNGNIPAGQTLTPGQTIQIPYFSSLANIGRVYGVSLGQLSTNAAMALPALLAQRAEVVAPSVDHTIGQGDCLSAIAQSYDLSLEDLAGRIALTPGLLAAVILNVSGLPAMKLAALTASLASGGGFTTAANMASRFMLNGLRLPAPQFANQPAPSPTAVYPFYALIGQEFPVAAPLPAGYSLTLTPQASAAWVQAAGGALSVPLTTAEIQRVQDFSTLSFQGGTESQLQPLPLYGYVPDRQPVRQIKPWLTPDGPPDLKVANQKANQLRLWPMPDALIGAIASSPSGGLPYQAAVSSRNNDGSVNTSALTATRWTTTVDITLQQLPDPVAGAYLVMGADQEGMQRLLALWAHASAWNAVNNPAKDPTKNTAISLYLAYPQQSSSNASGAMVSDALDRGSSFLLRTNLSTESHGEPVNLAARMATRLSSPADASPVASLETGDSLRFLELLWECSVVKSGGYYLRYAIDGGQVGLPDTLFASGRQATVTLVAVLDDLQPLNFPLAYPFNNAMLVADNVDTGADTVLFEAIVHTVATSDTLASVAAALPALAPPLAAALTPAGLAVANQTILGLLVVGETVAGQLVGPDDTLGSIATRAGMGVDALGTAIANQAVLRPGALMQLIGEPTQQVRAGDTLASISTEYDFLDPAALAALNATSTTLLSVGAAMTIPGQADHPIASTDTFASIATTTGVDVASLGEANGDSDILAVDATIQVAGDTLRLTAALPPGHVGFSLVRPNPQPQDLSQETPQQALDTLFNLLGFQVRGNAFFAASNEGLPAGPNKDPADTSASPPWNYRQVAAVYTLANDNEAAVSPALPPKLADPYAGVTPGSTAILDLTFQDILGNRTQGSGLSVNAPVGYTDELVALSAWPAVTTSYSFFQPVAASGLANFALAIAIAPNRYLPGAASGDAASKRASQDLAQYATIAYQLQQTDVTCFLSTTLGAFAQPDQLGPATRVALQGVANAAYVFLDQATGLSPITAGMGPTGAYKTFSALIDPNGATPGYPTTYGDLAQANANARADLLFGEGATLTVPKNSVVKAGDTGLAVADANQITVAVLADNNADLPLAPGVAVATLARPFAVPAGAPLCLQALADSANANTTVADGPGGAPGLATSNPKATLSPSLTLLLGDLSFTTGASDTLTTAAADFQQKRGSPVDVADVAMANLYLDGIFPVGTPLQIGSVVTRVGDTLASLAQDPGPPPAPPAPPTNTDSPAALLLTANQAVPNLWPAGTPLFIETIAYKVAQGDTLSSVASGSATTVQAVLTDNADLAVAANVPVAIPYLADNTAITWSTYQSAGGETFAEVVARFAGWTPGQLGLDNQDVAGLFAPVPITLSGITVTPTVSDTFATLAAQFKLTPDALAAAVAAIAGLVRAGGVMVAPAMASLAGDTLASAARRYALDRGSLAAANASLPGLLAAGQSVTIDGTTYATATNDAFALLTARINAARQAQKPPLPSVSINQVGEAATAVGLAARALLSPPRAANILATAAPANAQPIQHIAVNLAVSRDPARVAPAFQNAPRVVSSQTGVTAAPFAGAGAPDPRALTLFAQAFESAFPGLKLATGPDHVQGSTVLGKPSMLGAAASSSASGRGLWAVNFTAQGQGFTYEVDGAAALFFGVPPLSTDTWNGANIAVPTYDGANGLQWPGKTMNFRSVDPDQWNRVFLSAVDLLLSPSYSVNGATDTDIAAALGQVLQAKSDIAGALKLLVAPIVAGDSTGLADAQDALQQQLLVALGRLYEVQALVQLPVTVQGGGAGSDPTTSPQLSGKLVARVVTTPPDGAGPPVDPAHPLAVLAGQCGVSDAYLAMIVAEIPRIVRPQVTVTLSGATYVTQAQDTLSTIAAQFKVDVPTLAASMTTGTGDPNPFLGSTAINVTPLIAPAAFTTLTDVAGWLTATVEDTLLANRDRTDFFTGPTVSAGPHSAPTGQSVAAIAQVFGGIPALAQALGEVDAGGLPGGYALNPAAPPRALQLVPQTSFTTAKAPLCASGSRITSLFSIKDPAAHKSVTLDLDYSVNQLEFDIHGVAGIAGYQNSSWLSFVIPLADTAQTSGAAGQIQIPVPLRGYPPPVVISNQVSETGWPGGNQNVQVLTAETQATETQWNYGFSALRQTAAQDVLSLEVRFNTSGGTSSVNGPPPAPTSPHEAVIEALAAFSVVWPTIADDLAQLPDLQAGTTPAPSILHAVQALQQLIETVRKAWMPTLRAEALPVSEQVYTYALSALTQGEPPYFSALILDRLDQTAQDAPDDFLFTAPSAADTGPLDGGKLPADLAAVFAAYGFPVGAPTVVVNRAGADWSVVDETAVQTTPDGAFTAPQTYRILHDPASSVLTVWRQYLWPAVRLTPAAGSANGSTGWLNGTQSGARLVLDLPPNTAMVDQPLALDFAFYRLNLLLLQNAWGGSYVSRNSNLIQGGTVNPAFVYQTPLAMFPTKITPFFTRSNPLALAGDTLRDAVSSFFETLVSAQMATAPGTTRQIRVQGRYRQALDGVSDPSQAALVFDTPLVLVPLYSFNVSTDWSSSDTSDFCAQLTQALVNNATAAGIPLTTTGQYVLDVMVYNVSSDATTAPQPLLRLENLTYPRK